MQQLLAQMVQGLHLTETLDAGGFDDVDAVESAGVAPGNDLLAGSWRFDCSLYGSHCTSYPTLLAQCGGRSLRQVLGERGACILQVNHPSGRHSDVCSLGFENFGGCMRCEMTDLSSFATGHGMTLGTR